MKNNEINKKIKFNISDYFIIVMIIICLFLSIYKVNIIELNENQVLYLFSTGAQVIAGLFGLTLAGYTFLNDKLEKEVINDETLYDAIEELKKIYYKMIKRISKICIISISLCMLNMSIYNISKIPIGINILIINFTIGLILSEVLYIVEFIIKVTDPNKIAKVSEELNTEKNNTIEEQGDFVEFLKKYNELESLIIEFSQELISNNKDIYNKKYENQNKYKPRIFDSLEILSQKKIITKDMFYRIDEIRRYRNYVVHGTDVKISKSMYDNIVKIYDTVYNNINEYKSNIK